MLGNLSVVLQLVWLPKNEAEHARSALKVSIFFNIHLQNSLYLTLKISGHWE